MSIPYAELDPNIRKVVKWLNDNGFQTSDSGDGEHKFKDFDPVKDEAEISDLEDEGVLRYPHAIIQVGDPAKLVEETDRLHGLVENVIGEVFPHIEGEAPNLWIQANYDPTNRIPCIVLAGLSDDWFDPYDKFGDGPGGPK